MSEQDQDQKTEQATGKRLSEAREQGKVPISRETVSWVTFLAILVGIAWFMPAMFQNMIGVLRPFLERPDAVVMNESGLQTVVLDALVHTALAVGGFFLLLAAAGILGVMSQTGLFAATELLKPDISRLSFTGGIKNLFSLNSVMELIKSLGKMLILGSMAFMVLLPVIHQLPTFTGLPLMVLLEYLHHQAIHLITMILVAFTIIAAGDLFYQRFNYAKSLRMTKTEVKDEFKQQEGDPAIKGRLRQLRLEKARKRMMAQVPKADVIITNPTHYAVALKYDTLKMGAPVVVAKGVDLIAGRIRDVAEENKIPLVSNPPLARALYDTVDLDREIPSQHYKAVAEVISYIYKLKGKR